MAFFVNNNLISIACTYIRTKDVWVIGDVYTKPEYRGRGYAKIATSAITRDAIIAGTIPLLHVNENNTPAIKLYKKLGYKIIRKRPWIRFEI